VISGAIVVGMTQIKNILKNILIVLFASLLVVGAAVLVDPSEAGAASDASPTRALKSFAFSTEMTVAGGDSTGPTVSIQVKGLFEAPSSSDCRVSFNIGGFRYRERAVVLADRVFVDDGDGLRRAKRSDFDFAALCASDPGYWDDFPTLPRAAHGAPATRNGIKAEHFDLRDSVDSFSHFLGDNRAADLTVDQADLFLAAEGRWPVAVDVRLSGGSDEACAAIAGTDGASGVTLTAPCSVSHSVELSRPNDATIKVRVPHT
jgi:hypothetical protein